MTISRRTLLESAAAASALAALGNFQLTPEAFAADPDVIASAWR